MASARWRSASRLTIVCSGMVGFSVLGAGLQLYRVYRSWKKRLKRRIFAGMNVENFERIRGEVGAYSARMVAVSKLKSVSDIGVLYGLGQRAFGENYVQELVQKYELLPKDIEWHFIGHLQRNKVRYIVPFVDTIQSVDSVELLEVIEREAAKVGRVVRCLLQVHVAKEESKFGFSAARLLEVAESINPLTYKHLYIGGLMGMASFTDDVQQVTDEFGLLRSLFERLRVGRFAGDVRFKELSMGMSGDYLIALKEGSTLVRIGSLLFGAR